MEETKELDKVQNKKVTLFIGGKEREIKFNFSAWAKIEKEFDGLKNLEKRIQERIQNEAFTIIPHLLFIGLKDKSAYTDENGNEYPEITEENILDDYGLGDVERVTEILLSALYGTLPEESKKAVEAAMETK